MVLNALDIWTLAMLGGLADPLGIGGGILVTPVLVLGFSVPIHAAVGASPSR